MVECMASSFCHLQSTEDGAAGGGGAISARWSERQEAMTRSRIGCPSMREVMGFAKGWMGKSCPLA